MKDVETDMNIYELKNGKTSKINFVSPQNMDLSEIF